MFQKALGVDVNKVAKAETSRIQVYYWRKTIEDWFNKVIFILITPKPIRMHQSNLTPDLDELATRIIGLAIKVHRALGPGLLESSYKECLYYELARDGLRVEKEKGLPLIYNAIRLDIGYRIDLLVENKLIIEVKSVEALSDIHLAQVLTYLKLSGCHLALLINFNVSLLKTGIRRVAL